MSERNLARNVLLTLLLAGAVGFWGACRGLAPQPPDAGIRTASDEPPIRVKGGSIDLQLFPVLGASQWTKDNKKTNKWDLLPSGRKVKNISVLVDGKDDSKCTVVTIGVDSVTFTLGKADAAGNIQAAGSVTLSTEDDNQGNGKKHSVATGTATLNVDPTNRKLSLPATGFIWKISSGLGTPSALDCTFASKDDLNSVYVFEW